MDAVQSAPLTPTPGSPPRSLVGSTSEDLRRRREKRRRLARAVRQAALALVILAAAVGVVLALRPSPVPVDLARAVRGPLAVVIRESGVTRVKDRYVVSAPVSGTLWRVSLEPGDPVKEGDTLVEIAPGQSPLLDERTRAQAEGRLAAALSALGQAQAQTARATSEKELAEQELARTRKLAASGALSDQALDHAEFAARMRSEELASAIFAVKVASEEVRIARAALGRDDSGAAKQHIDVIAPVSGRVLRVHQESAGVVQAGAPLIEVGDPAALEVVVDLLTTDAVHVRPGTEVVLEGWGGEHEIAGRVHHVEPSAFTRPSALGVDEQRVNVVIALAADRSQWAALGDGYRVEARLVLWQAPSVLQVPQGAVFRHGDAWAVYRIEEGVARLTPVRVGHRGETHVEILSGLAAGAEVAVHPGDRVRDQASVEAR